MRRPVGVPEEGCCPVCHGEVALTGGLVTAHGAWRMGRHGPRVTGEPCSGEGMAPEVEA
ncbi:hypothetical protein [Paractinoplanes toevensis]|nr:hypothetical protein [Actinoplanes toevensis]